MTSFDTFRFFFSLSRKVSVVLYQNHINPLGHRSSKKDYDDRFRHYFVCVCVSLSLLLAQIFLSIDILRHYLLFIQCLTEEGKKTPLSNSILLVYPRQWMYTCTKVIKKVLAFSMKILLYRLKHIFFFKAIVTKKEQRVSTYSPSSSSISSFQNACHLQLTMSVERCHVLVC